MHNVSLVAQLDFTVRFMCLNGDVVNWQLKLPSESVYFARGGSCRSRQFPLTLASRERLREGGFSPEAQSRLVALLLHFTSMILRAERRSGNLFPRQGHKRDPAGQAAHAEPPNTCSAGASEID